MRDLLVYLLAVGIAFCFFVVMGLSYGLAALAAFLVMTFAIVVTAFIFG